MEKLLITGSTGFIGRQLLGVVENPRCVVRADEKHSLSNCFTVTNIDENTDWTGAFDGIEAIIHLAGVAHVNGEKDEAIFQSVNTKGTLALARQAASSGVRRFVFVSSIGVNGTRTVGVPFSPYEPPNPHNAYSTSKFDAEVGLKKIEAETGLEVVVVRPTLVYGPNAPGNFNSLVKLVQKLPVLPFGLADNRRDFIAVQNLVDLLITCVTHPNASGNTFLASDFETVSIKKFTNAISRGLGKSTLQIPLPISLMRLIGKITGKSTVIEQLYGDLEVDSSNLKEVLGWTPPLTMKQAMLLLNNSSR
ncbi:NAD-dependent epimerase/dehydratase family protein [Vibrio parahaemolyticus]|uniref:UDP-glucose 4-epimerase n=2 Tax=Vibrio parahaemolyticus TaxID=670 RepID=A0A5P5X548_VIBPH|nr:NAD-dependent epimerase/dehydratase family protein [Vibrio parahaemolyticus]EGQ8033488.1 NAD-dependent epimerase/dehydratase family protein [Vibrio parahaemolyticus]EGQ8924822.1 NAD-dependent epimerase/dehydratase family protein [Vibrio parahaemolyticus]EGR2860673.1 NAD-dependent epimerase/dehydratase family protein [Vibrio parahaemolyticus]EGR2948480.1 NAD-dependent epimerase/dehydratase family protein [Vibrio parahaemolyticus]EGR3067739.1 NAD-dependent epimerase/dehydratase family protein